MAAHQRTHLPGMPRNNLHIFQWNANGILPRLAELKNFLATQKHQPDVICIQETHLTDKKQLKIPSYSTERRDRGNGQRYGGVATLVKTDLTYTVMDNISDIEELTIKIKLCNQDLIISNIYNPPRNRIDEAQYINLASRRNIIMLGDFNAHLPLFGSQQVNSEGVAMEKVIEGTDLVVLNDKSGTHINRDGGLSCLDVTLASSSVALKTSWSVQHDSLGSDHLPIRIHVNDPPAVAVQNVTRYRFKRADWTEYHAASNITFQESLFDQDISTYSKNILHAIHGAAENSIPKTGNNQRARNTPYWNKKCADAVHNRKRAERRMRKTKELHDCINYRQQKAQAQKTIREEQKNSWNEYCSNLTTDTKLASVWKMAKNMAGTNDNSNIPTLTVNGRIYETPQQKAKLLAETIAAASADSNYSDTFKLHRREMETKWANEQPQNTGVNDEMAKLNQDFAFHELQQAIRQCKNSSAPGQDDISYELIKHLSRHAQQQLLQFYNNLWREMKIVPDWKVSVVLPFHKPGTDRTQPSSYRPISLTSALCKINERLVTTRLTYYLESNHLLNPYQSAYRKNRCTLDHLIRLHDHINRNINNKGATIAIFFDFSKAFDMLWKEGLMQKLKTAGIDGRMKNWIEDFLTGRKFQVKINGVLSDLYDLQNGTPQGSVISPILFLLMINDFPHTTSNTETSLYADDSAIWRSGRNIENIQQQLQPDIDKIAVWCDLWGFKLNEKKTVAIIFSKNYRHRQEKLKLKVNGNLISTVTSAKFLGVTFDQQLTWNEHINNIAESCKKRINLLRSLSGQQWGAGKHSMLKIYRTLIRPKIDYGIELFHTANKASWKKLEVLQSTCLRLACGAMRGTAVDALQQECGEMPLHLRRKRATLRYAAKLTASKNNPASAILQDSWHLHYGHYKPNTEPVLVQIGDFLSNNRLQPTAASSIEPWNSAFANVDTRLQTQLHRGDNPATNLQLVRQHLETYTSLLHIYTDASVQKSGAAGAAYYIPTESVEATIRLPNGTTILTAELLAIQSALQFLESTEVKNKDVAVITDSLSAANLLLNNRHNHSSTKSEIMGLVTSLHTKRRVTIHFVWVPGHVGLPGNEKVNNLARRAAEKQVIDTSQQISLMEIQQNIDNIVEAEWQQQYNISATARGYKQLEPAINRKIKFTNNNRRKETIITRLRLGKCLLNCYLHRINRHHTGLCDHCNLPETVEHFLLECPHANIFAGTNISSLQSALSNVTNQEKICKRLQELNRRI